MSEDVPKHAPASLPAQRTRTAGRRVALLGAALVAIVTIAFRLGSATPAAAQSGPPGAPEQAAPASGTTDTPTALYLYWNAPGGAVSGFTQYTVNVHDTTSGSSYWTAYTTNTYIWVSGLANGHTIWWLVYGCNGSACSYSSTTWIFVTAYLAPGPTLQSAPTDHAVGVNLTPALSWSAPSGAISGFTTYQVAYQDASTNAYGYSGQTTGLSITLTGLVSSRGYYWWVYACNSSHCAYSARNFTFTTAAACTNAGLAFSPASPALPGTTVTLSGSASCGSTPVYRYWLQTPTAGWTAVQNYSTTWWHYWYTSGLAPGNYWFEVDVKNAGSSDDYETLKVSLFTLAITPCSNAALALNPASASPGTTITLTGSASCGGTSIYRFWFQDPTTGWQLLQDYTTSAAYAWSTTGKAPGNYWIEVDIKNQGSSQDVESYAERLFTLTGPCTNGNLAFNPTSPASAGTTVTLTGSATCAGTAVYRYWLQTPTVGWTVVRNYATAATYSWSTSGLAPVNYWFEVDIKNQGSSADYETYKVNSYTLTVPACSGATLTFTPAAATVGTPVTATGSATCGTTPVYRFWLQTPTVGWTIVQDYSTTASYNWSTVGLAGGNYWFELDSKNQGSGADVESYKVSVFSLAWPTPSQLTPTAPANTATGVGTTPTLQWNVSATNYIAGTTQFTITLYDYATASYLPPLAATTASSEAVPASANLDIDRTYAWSGYACNGSSCSAVSNIFLFTTAPPPNAALQASPANGASNVGLSPTLSWNRPSQNYYAETHYYLSLYDQTVGSYVLQNADEATGLSAALSNLVSGRVYLWNDSTCNGINAPQDCTAASQWSQFSTSQQAPPTWPGTTSTFYFTSASATVASDLGCGAAQHVVADINVIVLDFGAQTTTGTQHFGVNVFATDAQVRSLGEQFMLGFDSCVQGSPLVYFVMGTNNSGSQVNSAAGSDWSSSVAIVGIFVADQCDPNFPTDPNRCPRPRFMNYQANGGIDFEPQFGSSANARAWANGYHSGPSPYAYWNFGSCDNCLSADASVGNACSYPTTNSCNIVDTALAGSDWHISDVNYVSGGGQGQGAPSVLALALPEIYSQNTAEQWAYVSLYGNARGQSLGQGLSVEGSLTQCVAVRQNPPGTTNSARSGWNQLYSELNEPRWAHWTGTRLPSSTDIAYQGIAIPSYP